MHEKRLTVNQLAMLANQQSAGVMDAPVSDVKYVFFY